MDPNELACTFNSKSRPSAPSRIILLHHAPLHECVTLLRDLASLPGISDLCSVDDVEHEDRLISSVFGVRDRRARHVVPRAVGHGAQARALRRRRARARARRRGPRCVPATAMARSGAWCSVMLRDFDPAHEGRMKLTGESMLALNLSSYNYPGFAESELDLRDDVIRTLRRSGASACTVVNATVVCSDVASWHRGRSRTPSRPFHRV